MNWDDYWNWRDQGYWETPAKKQDYTKNYQSGKAVGELLATVIVGIVQLALQLLLLTCKGCYALIHAVILLVSFSWRSAHLSRK